MIVQQALSWQLCNKYENKVAVNIKMYVCQTFHPVKPYW